jgi:hypothetical protein
MRHKNFIVLTGHLDEVSLADLIRSLHARGKSGRLQVEYPESPGLFYFEEGRLVDARLGDLRGPEALYLSLTLPGASYNFNPLVKPPEQTFSRHEQRHVQELLEGARGRGATEVAIPTAGGAVAPLKGAHPAAISRPEQPADAGLALARAATEGVLDRLSHLEMVLARHSRRFSRERAVYAVVIAFLLLLTIGARLLSRKPNVTEATPAAVVSTAPPESSGVDAARADAEASQPVVVDAPRQEEDARAEPERRAGKATDGAKPKTAASAIKPTKPNAPAPPSVEQSAQGSPERSRPGGGAEHVVQVSMKVEQGRVVEAAVKNPRAGMASYEALALRLARQRRYPDAFNGPDTLQLKVKP